MRNIQNQYDTRKQRQSIKKKKGAKHLTRELKLQENPIETGERWLSNWVICDLVKDDHNVLLK